MSDKVSINSELVPIGLQLAELKAAVQSGAIDRVIVEEQQGVYRIYATLLRGSRRTKCALVRSKGDMVREFKKPMTYATLLKNLGIDKWELQPAPSAT